MREWRDLPIYRDARSAFHDYLTQRVERVTPVRPGPTASREVLITTSLQRKEELSTRTRRGFLASGHRTLQTLLEQAESGGFELRSARAVMELGCGGARLLRHLRGVDGLRLVGADVNAETIAWCRNALPGIEFHQNDLSPPLMFAEDDTLDLVFAYSVFTHIPLELQTPWIEEIRRVLRPGGFLAATVMGPERAAHVLDPALQERLEREGVLELGAGDDRVSYSTRASASWDVYATRSAVEEMFGSVMQLRGYHEGDQSTIVLRKS